MADPLLCARPVSGTAGQQGRIHPTTGFWEGRAPLWSHAVSATVLCKIECCPPKPKFWGCHPRPPQGTAHRDQMLLKRKLQRAHTHTHARARTHTYPQMPTVQRAFTLHQLQSVLSPLSAWAQIHSSCCRSSETLKAFSGRLPYQQRKECSGSLVWPSLGGSSMWVGMSGSSTGREGARVCVGGHERRRNRSGNGRSPGPAEVRSEQDGCCEVGGKGRWPGDLRGEAGHAT